MKLNDYERKVLMVLAKLRNKYGDDTRYYPFAPLMDETGLDRKAVRRACRSLKRKGLARFLAGLWRDDGLPGGAGYAATQAGVALVEERV